MKKPIIAYLLGACAVAAMGAPTSDPVLMNVDGHDIRVSEFEYLYNKNNSQQSQPQTLDQYLGMFIDYKLKVAEAEHAGLDRTTSFLDEYGHFRRDLAAPYMRDRATEDSLVAVAYNMIANQRKVSHIMMPVMDGVPEFLDSLRSEILAGNVTFEEVAAEYSIDRNSKIHGGSMGWISPMRLPYPFVEAAYQVGVGEITPVVNSGFGNHIIRVDEQRANPGEVLVQHILLLTRGRDEAELPAVRAKIDSLYQIAAADPSTFFDLASRFSEDPGTRSRGGRLDWFGPGAMVAEFDSVSFALPNGAVSEPFATSFGYHIIYKLDSRPMGDLESMRQPILESMNQDSRASLPGTIIIDREMRRLHAKVNDKNLNKIEKMIARNPGGYDSTMISRLRTDRTVVATYDGGAPIRVCDVMGNVATTASTSAADARSLIAGAAYGALRTAAGDVYRDNLANTNADYRNLLNEYRDGILLYEISNREVWDRATRDQEGLQAYFRAHADRYAWATPKFKSIIIFASSDSVLTEALAYAETLDRTDPEAFNSAMRTRFGRDVKVERVIAARGENPITDYLAFGGQKPTGEIYNRWNTYAAFHGRVLDAPEEAADVRGAAVTDYQAELERQWLENLRRKYRVTVHQDVFDALKAAHANQ